LKSAEKVLRYSMTSVTCSSDRMVSKLAMPV